MAQYSIDHSCGHTQTQHIYGTNSKGQRERMADWLARGLCTDCYEAQRAAEYAEQTAQAKRGTAHLPALTGSDKQIAWAETIRAGAFNRLTKIEKYMQTHTNLSDKDQRHVDDAIEIIADLLSTVDSRFWIGNRDAKFNEHWLAARVAKPNTVASLSN